MGSVPIPRTGTPNMRTGSLNKVGKHNFAALTEKTAHWLEKTAPRFDFMPHWLKKTAHWLVEHAHWQKKQRTGTLNTRTGSLNTVGKHNFTALAGKNCPPPRFSPELAKNPLALAHRPRLRTRCLDSLA